MAKNHLGFITLLTVLVFFAGCSNSEGEPANSPETEPNEVEIVKNEPNEPEPVATEPNKDELIKVDPNNVKPLPK